MHATYREALYFYFFMEHSLDIFVTMAEGLVTILILRPVFTLRLARQRADPVLDVCRKLEKL